MNDAPERTEEQFLAELPTALTPCAHQLIELGWSLTLRPDQPADVRKRLEAEHPDGHRILVLARPTARAGHPAKWPARNNRYFARPEKDHLWYRLDGMQSLIAYATTATLDSTCKPADTDPCVAPSNKQPPRCDCEKRQFSRRKAETVLLAAKMKRGLGGNARRRERRAYRCDVDSSVWHLTSQAAWRA